MKLPKGWISQEFGTVVSPVASKPIVTKTMRCIELEHVSQNTGRLLGWRDGQVTEVSKSSFVKGDVLFGKLRPYLRKAWHATFDGICSSEFWVLSVNHKSHDAAFIKQFALSNIFSRATYASSGSKMPRAAWDMVSAFPFTFPPLPEQRKIAEILSTWDEALEKLDALIQAKERRKKALMQQLLTGKKRVNGLSEPWKTLQLGALIKSELRPTPKPKGKFLAAGIRCHGKGVFLKPEFVAEDIALDELYALKSGDLVVNITFAWEGAAAIVPPAADGALVSHRFPTYAFLEGKASTAFFRHYILSERFVFDCGLASPGGAGRNRVLSKSAFLNIELRVPSFAEQENIGAVLDDVADELRLLRSQRNALDQQKRGLMQRLLTGKVRVNV